MENPFSAVYSFQQKESTIDFEGHISLVAFTKGCDLCCSYCHNPDLIPFGGQDLSWEELKAATARAKKNWADGFCITGGEPCAKPALAETCSFVRQQGLAVKLDTNGTYPSMLEKALPFCSFVAMDYKAPADMYSQIAGRNADTSAVRRSLDILRSSGIPCEIRITVLPEFHTREILRQMCTELSGITTVSLQPFIPRPDLPSERLRTASRPSDAYMKSLADIFTPFIPDIKVR